MQHHLDLFIKAVFIENLALSFFLGMCTFLAGSKSVKTALGLGMLAVTILRSGRGDGRVPLLPVTLGLAIGGAAVPSEYPLRIEPRKEGSGKEITAPRKGNTPNCSGLPIILTMLIAIMTPGTRC